MTLVHSGTRSMVPHGLHVVSREPSCIGTLSDSGRFSLRHRSRAGPAADERMRPGGPQQSGRHRRSIAGLRRARRSGARLEKLAVSLLAMIKFAIVG